MPLDPDTARFHTQPPKSRAGQVRFDAPREKKPFIEALTWSIPEMSSTGMTLAFQWDTVYVPVRIKVSPTYSTIVSADVARRTVGRYHSLHFRAHAGSAEGLHGDGNGGGEARDGRDVHR